MAPRTRSTTSSPVKPSYPPPDRSIRCLNQHEPLQPLIMPAGLSSHAKILTMPHPRDRSPTRFLFCPEKGLFEFTKIASSPMDPRSVLFAPSDRAHISSTGLDSSYPKPSGGFVNKVASVLVVSPFDLAFLLLPLIPSSFTTSNKTLFQPLDDLLEGLMNGNKGLSYIVRHGRHKLEEAMTCFCDEMTAGDENMYRANEAKILRLLHNKANAVLQSGFPPSLEEKFVTRTLEAPILSVKREELVVSTLDPNKTMSTPGDDIKSECFDSQSTVVSSTTPSIFSEVSAASSVTTLSTEPVSADIKRLQRLKTAFNSILALYIPTNIADQLRSTYMMCQKHEDFAPLTQHLEELARLRAEAMASRSLGDFSRKRGNADEDEAAEEKTEKKRKLDEEERRKKASESRGVRELKKVNIAGMKKMSDFFVKKPSAAKAKS